ncbi:MULTISPECIES: SIR2 family protein [Bacillus cereus group]|uniref:SIR2 family protein n=1 Tax=Bacillus cereus group TaxID=86661 RepID=UPI002E1BA8C8|nr:SIR2 family protein [Bacillus wiedmannii]
MYKEYLEKSIAKLKMTLDDSGTRPILFVGSGFSIRYINGPNWLGLLKQLVELNPEIKMPIGYYNQKKGGNYPLIASAIVEEYQSYAWMKQGTGLYPEHLYGTEFSDSIYLKYQIKMIFEELLSQFNLETNVHKDEIEILKTLNPHAIITTNYDQLLETLFPNFNVIVGEQVIKDRKALNIGHILKVHGCVSNPEEIIISDDDYKLFKKKRKYLSAKLLTYFMEHPIVFIGYSISDENIQKILSDISEIVSETEDEIVNNIWFVEWKKESIPEDFTPPIDKVIPLGEGQNIRVNYLLVNTFEDVYKSLMQSDKSDIDFLSTLQENIYNIVKSKTVTNLEVDMVRMNGLRDIETLSSYLGFKSKSSEQASTTQVTLGGFGQILDPEQALARYPMRLTDVSSKLGYSYWHKVNVAINKVKTDTNFDIKGSNNIYHIDMGINGSQHRYSADFLELITKVINEENYEVITDTNEKIEVYSRSLQES